MNEEQLLIAKLLKVLEENILPLTKIEVKRGNKIFGAAILKKSDLNLVERLCYNFILCSFYFSKNLMATSNKIDF